jgi:NAD(P)-dependent dehydrogenase (short-subunit alcohol dehydrogenase family)
MSHFDSEHRAITDFDGRPAVVTGGASGIGHAIARRLARAGSKVIVVDKDRDKLAAARRSFEDESLDVVPVVGDLAGRDTGRLADELLNVHGTIPLIVNNVGMCTGDGYYGTGEDDFDLVFATNLRGPWFFTRRLTEELIRRREPGSVLFISSLHDQFVLYRPQYSASKASVSQLVRELAALLAPYGIRVNAISPGWIDTAGPERVQRQRLKADNVVPLGRGGLPDDVAAAAIFLLSEASSSYITGANLPVDGGLALQTWHPHPLQRSAPFG